ncbi:ORF1169 [White spot syndrome virus]|uniref:Wsv114 n=3 Tax=White spot syndrome virus TaxID=342409 RepID=Q8VB73_WSSVS|nr:wsv114 [Shrimp white spot syndrome virus]AFX59491.1 wsv114 [White spot syndrome virus]AAL33118.1 wsv114 [Shrimp white spot syndrome virus]AAL89038.1 WSSV170 [Shrimp white spot syndrome virus]ATU83960.1 ORF1169 [White spot syndrome virus]AWQ60302.1 wsv114 [Shrimp white spot syndrome virus]
MSRKNRLCILMKPRERERLLTLVLKRTTKIKQEACVELVDLDLQITQILLKPPSQETNKKRTKRKNWKKGRS